MKANDDVLDIDKTTTGSRFNEARQKRTTIMMGPSTDPEISSTTAAPPPPPSAPATASLPQVAHTVAVRYQHFLDKSVPQILNRWIATAAIALVYFLRVYYLQGFYIITYGLGIYMLNLLIGFLSPQVDPEILELTDGPSLPTRGSDEFRPFVRRLPEFKCWLSITRAFLIAFGMTFFSVFDVPVFWPILLFYWIMLFMLTMRRQITLMIKYKYVPFTFGKRRYDRKGVSAAEVTDLPRD